ncbi:hypothetical protein I302_103242 [Kwoniella bestiolae CBS 10118]|uniref:Diphthamide biosynthesis protein 4 n=1 Tax=Kwoniella bestiolae CBS 10118 TaxID=1296100 RepID=A0AAJ8M7I3_9TREE
MSGKASISHCISMSISTRYLPNCHRPTPKLNQQSGISSPPPNYYSILGLSPTASDEDVIRSWRRLALIHHPDKKSIPPADDTNEDNDIRLINEAKSILLDPTRKQQWLDAFSSYDNKNSASQAKKEGPHIFRNISLDEFTPHYQPSSSTTRSGGVGNGEEDEREEEEEEAQPQYFTYPCRCSSEFIITLEQLEDNVDIVGCEGCGEWIKVGYEVVEEEE